MPNPMQDSKGQFNIDVTILSVYSKWHTYRILGNSEGQLKYGPHHTVEANKFYSPNLELSLHVWSS